MNQLSFLYVIAFYFHHAVSAFPCEFMTALNRFFLFANTYLVFGPVSMTNSEDSCMFHVQY